LVILLTDTDRHNPVKVEMMQKMKTQIIEIQEKINPNRWRDYHVRLLNKYDKQGLFGKEAIEKINKTFEVNKTSYEDITITIKELISDTSSFYNNIKQMIEGLEPLVKPIYTTSNSIDIDERNHLLFISFDEALFIKDIPQLEKFCRIWNRIIAAFTILTNEKLEDIRIYDIESTSITFYAGIKTINTMTRGTHQVLLGYKKVLEVRRLQLELDNLQLSFKEEIKTLLEDEIVNIVDIISGKVAEELLQKYNWEQNEKYRDVYNMVQISLKQTLDFMEKGGKIESKHSSDLSKLNETINKIRHNIFDMETGGNSHNSDIKI
jgi:hypothetical protein